MRKKKLRYYIKRSENKELLKKLHDQIFPADIWCGLESTVAWVVWYDKQPIGFCLMDITSDEFGYYTRAGILKKHWGNGLHKRMILVREKFARQFGYKRIVTYTLTNNIQSIANLQKRGYLIYEPKRKYAGENFLYWEKHL